MKPIKEAKNNGCEMQDIIYLLVKASQKKQK